MKSAKYVFIFIIFVGRISNKKTNKDYLIWLYTLLTTHWFCTN